MIMQRRSFLAGVTGLLVAPAIVRAESLMRLPARMRPRVQIIRVKGFDQFGNLINESFSIIQLDPPSLRPMLWSDRGVPRFD